MTVNTDRKEYLDYFNLLISLRLPLIQSPLKLNQDMHYTPNMITAIAYYAIPAQLILLLIRARSHIPTSWILSAFSAIVGLCSFILACGTGHYLSAIDSPMLGNWHWVTAITSFGFVLAFTVLQDQILALAERSHLNWINASRDRLTGLLNRHGFDLVIEREMNKDNPNFALFLIDLDRFKAVNDTYGHNIGDEVLRICGKRIVNATKKEDAIARFGGDEFVVLMPGISRDGALNRCDRIRQNIEAPIAIDGLKISVGASCGICLYAPGYSVEELIAFADVAMYKAKSRSVNGACCVIWDG